jgi:hypothetical protein
MWVKCVHCVKKILEKKQYFWNNCLAYLITEVKVKLLTIKLLSWKAIICILCDE